MGRQFQSPRIVRLGTSLCRGGRLAGAACRKPQRGSTNPANLAGYRSGRYNIYGEAAVNPGVVSPEAVCRVP